MKLAEIAAFIPLHCIAYVMAFKTNNETLTIQRQPCSRECCVVGKGHSKETLNVR